MKIDYDQAEQNSFQIRGETFVIPRKHPNVIAQMQTIEEKFDKATTHQEILEIMEERLVLILDDGNGAVERWQALRADEANPITYGEIADMSRKVVEMVTGVPTLLPASSQAGQRGGKTAPSSKGE